MSIKSLQFCNNSKNLTKKKLSFIVISSVFSIHSIVMLCLCEVYDLKIEIDGTFWRGECWIDVRRQLTRPLAIFAYKTLNIPELINFQPYTLDVHWVGEKVQQRINPTARIVIFASSLLQLQQQEQAYLLGISNWECKEETAWHLNCNKCKR